MLLAVIIGLLLYYDSAALGSEETKTFLSTPLSLTYGELGGMTVLNWTYNSSVSPTFKKWYQSTEANLQIGKSIMFQSGGNSATVYKEEFKGRVEYFANAGLIIRNISLQDEGYIRFEVNFNDGTDLHNRIILNVTIKPQLTTFLPNETIAVEGSNSTVQCTFQARPIPEIKWFMNGKQMSGDPRFGISSQIIGVVKNMTIVRSSLKIMNARPEDNGVLRCEADIPFGSLSSQTIHKVLYSPRNTSFGSDKSSSIGILGGNITLTCHAVSLPVPHYQIFHNGILRSNSTTGSMVITNLKTSHEGEYSCVPVNFLGSGEGQALNVTVHVPTLRYGYSGSTKVAMLNTTVNISCTFYGEPSPKITWEKYNDTMPSTIITESTILSTNSSFTVVRSTLKWMNVRKSDHGTYICNAENLAGKDRQVIVLDVNYKPEIMTKLNTNRTLVEDKSKNASWVFTVQGNPMVYMSWLLNGKVISAGSGFDITNKVVANSSSGITLSSTLVMTGITREKAGVLTCNASSSAGVVLSSSDVIINHTPSTTLTPKRSNVTVNRSRTLSCEIMSQPAAVASWQRNGAAVNGSNYVIKSTVSAGLFTSRVSSNLTILAAEKSDFGRYECIGENTIGRSNGSAYISILYGPEFIRKLPPLANIEEGSRNYSMMCTVRSYPVSSISWSVNNTQIPSSSSQWPIFTSKTTTDKYVEFSSTLTIANISKESFAKFTCLAANDIGSSSSMQQLVVTYKPFLTRAPTSRMYVNSSGRIDLSCDFQSNPSPDVYWRRHNQTATQLSPKSNSSVVHLFSSMRYSSARAVLTILNASLADNGVYTCGANNSLGFNERNVTLIVNYEPVIVSMTSSPIISQESSNISLHCTGSSNPESTISWFYGGKSLVNDSRTTILVESQQRDVFTFVLKSTIFIRNLTRNDTGEYTCEASNGITKAVKKLEVVVQYAPMLTSSFSTTMNIIESDKPFALTCSSTADPAPSITWRKDGVMQTRNITTQINKTSPGNTVNVQSRLEFNRGVKRIDHGRYRCNASNYLGSQVKEVNLQVWYRAEFLSNSSVKLDKIKTSNASFTCKVEGYPAPTLHWYKADQRLANVNDTELVSTTPTVLQSTLIINNVSKEDSAEYVCMATNNAGNNSQVFTLNVQYKPVLFAVSRNITAKYGARIDIDCKTDANPTVSRYNWTKDGVYLTETSSVFSIKSAKESSSGTYSCTPINELGDGGSVQFVLFVESSLPGYQPLLAPKDETWAIVLYVLIPVLAVFCIVMCVWLANARGCRKEDKEFIVPLNSHLSKPPCAQSMPTRRDIYLPDGNFGVLNSAYRSEDTEMFPRSQQNDKFDTVEVEMQFDEEEHYQPVGGVIEEEREGQRMQGNGVVQGPNSNGNLTFYNTAYTHL